MASEKGLCPVDPGADGLKVAFADPGRLRFDALAGQCRAVLHDEALLPGDPADDVAGNRDAVGGAEDLDAAAPVRRLRVAQPAQAFGVVTERRRVLEGVGDVEDRRRGPRVVEIDQARRLVSPPDSVPWAEVTVADDLARCARARPAGPAGAGRRAVARHGVVIAAQERRPAAQPALRDDLRPAGRTGLAVDPGELLPAAVGTQRTRSGEARRLQVAEQAVDGRRPELCWPPDEGTRPLDAAAHRGCTAESSMRRSAGISGL